MAAGGSEESTGVSGMTVIKPRRVRLSDVANRAGVSAVTVSRALRNPRLVSEALRRRVESAVGELAYIPNQMASALASAQTNTIGVVVPSLTNGVFGDYLRGIHDVLMPRGFQVLVLNARYSPIEEEKAIATLLGRQPEAMIVAGIDQTDHARRLLEQSGVPVVQTMELTDDPIDINIGMSHLDAGYQAAQYLLGLGHRRIGVVEARLDARAQRRLDGYRRAMDEAGIDTIDLVASSARPSNVKIGGELLQHLLATAPGVDAVFCCNDDLALGVLFACQRHNIRVPQDMSILGFNDLDFAASAYPALSSMATPRFEMGKRAAEAILQIIRAPKQRPAETRIDLGFRINERDSTRARTPPQRPRRQTEGG
jgi:LacI family transcriptional regulator, gluconate utilization system Gnt-I transcriptional repressor